MSARNVHKIELAVRRTVNANLDDSIDELQLRHLIARALSKRTGEQDIVRGLREAQVTAMDGQPIESYVRQIARAFKAHDFH
jgi:hypothetical protein